MNRQEENVFEDALLGRKLVSWSLVIKRWYNLNEAIAGYKDNFSTQIRKDFTVLKTKTLRPRRSPYDKTDI